MDKTDITYLKMNILMVSINFYPSIGGIEIVTENLANEFVKMGHQVTVITNTPDDKSRTFPFTVLRNPSIRETFKAYKKCDVYVHQAISLKYVWPLFILRKPFFIVYHQVGWEPGIKGRIKKVFSHFAHNICVSETTAKGYGLKKYNIIYNAYNDIIFMQTNFGERKDIAFVGRLNRDKGAYLLIKAFNDFKESSHSDYELNLIGDSEERKDIEEFAKGTKYSSDIHFLGPKSPTDIVQILNQHKILAVSSTHPYYEAFGIVVLEGLACGCVVVGADGDGIEEALHGCGLLYKNGSSCDLTESLLRAYVSNESIIDESWLMSRRLENVAKQYLKSFKTCK